MHMQAHRQRREPIAAHSADVLRSDSGGAPAACCWLMLRLPVNVKPRMVHCATALMASFVGESVPVNATEPKR